MNATPKSDWSIDRENDFAIRHIQSWDTLDFVEIDAASHTWVDNIREEIIDKAIYPPTTLRKKVYVIDEVHMLSKWAFNALLKIMEEPREYLIFILATTEIHKVPDTIISRCQTFTFRNLTIPQISGRLEYIAQQEKIEFEKDWLDLLAKLSNGALRDGIKYLEQVSILWPITSELVSKFLWVVQWVVLEELMNAIEIKDYQKFEVILQWLVDRGANLQSLAKDIFRWLDAHFSQNPSLWSPRVSVFKEISSDMRRYPQPELVRKKKVWMLCNQEPKVMLSTPIQKITTDKWIKSIEKVRGSIDKKMPTSQIPIPQVINNEQETKKEVVIAAETIVEKPQIQWVFEWSLVQLLAEIATKVDKKMIQWILAKQTTIDSHSDWKMTMIVINRIYASTLSKDDTVRMLEWVVKEITWHAVQITVQYMSKEDFMRKQLGS